MNTTPMHLSESLSRRIQSIVQEVPDPAAVDAAQARLEAAIAGRAPRTRMRRGLAWAGAACTVAVLALVLILAPVFTSSGGRAFAAVQQRLRDFRTLEMTITQRANGIALPTIHAWARRDGSVHTDIGGSTSVVVNTQDHAMLVLLHASHEAMRMPLDAPAGAKGKADVLGWLDAVRDFKGKAHALPGTRLIDGRITHGWALDSQGLHIELWADDDGVPHSVDIGGSTELHQRLQLTVDHPIDPARFSTQVPPGYRRIQPD